MEQVCNRGRLVTVQIFSGLSFSLQCVMHVSVYSSSTVLRDLIDVK